MAHKIREELRGGEKGERFIDAFLDAYLTPAFGARSKSEIDLLVFTALVYAGAVDPDAPIYEIARSFNLTTTRARTLVLNWQLRSAELSENLNERLTKALQKTRFSKDGSLLTFGVESPLLREEIEARLKRKGIFADASFQKDIIRMPVEAFVEFLDELLPSDVKDEVRTRLIKDKQLPDKSFKALAKGVLGKLGEKVMGEVGKEIAGDLVSGAGEIAGPAAERVSSFISGLLEGNGKRAVDAVQPGEIIV